MLSAIDASSVTNVRIDTDLDVVEGDFARRKLCPRTVNVTVGRLRAVEQLDDRLTTRHLPLTNERQRYDRRRPKQRLNHTLRHIYSP